MRKTAILLSAAATLVFMAACTKEAPPEDPPAAEAAPAAGAASNTVMLAFMKEQVDPAAMKASNVGYNDAGEKLAATDPAWAEASAAADQLIAFAGELQKPEQVQKKDDADTEWTAHAVAMGEAAKAVKAAIETHDGDKVTEAAGPLYEVCAACHTKYQPVPPT